MVPTLDRTTYHWEWECEGDLCRLFSDPDVRTYVLYYLYVMVRTWYRTSLHKIILKTI